MLALWHGFNAAAADERGALAGGGLHVLGAAARSSTCTCTCPRGRTGRLAVQEAHRRRSPALAAARDRPAENGSLQRSLVLARVATALVLGAAPLLGSRDPSRQTPARAGRPARRHCGAVLRGGRARRVALHRDRLVGVILAGVVGLVVRSPSLGLSAPDLALTQFSVEVVSTVLLLLGLALLPAVAPRSPRRCAAAAMRSRRRGGGGASAGSPGGDDARPRLDLLVLPRRERARGRRRQRRQRHPGRLPRLRHLRRDHGARDRRPSACCAARWPGRALHDALQAPSPHAPLLLAVAARGAAAGAGVSRLPLLARPQPAGRRLHRRPDHRGRAGPAVHARRARPAAHARVRARYALARQRRPAGRAAHRRRRLVPRRAVPDQRPRRIRCCRCSASWRWRRRRCSTSASTSRSSGRRC